MGDRGTAQDRLLREALRDLADGVEQERRPALAEDLRALAAEAAPDPRRFLARCEEVLARVAADAALSPAWHERATAWRERVREALDPASAAPPSVLERHGGGLQLALLAGLAGAGAAAALQAVTLGRVYHALCGVGFVVPAVIVRALATGGGAVGTVVRLEPRAGDPADLVLELRLADHVETAFIRDAVLHEQLTRQPVGPGDLVRCRVEATAEGELEVTSLRRAVRRGRPG